MACPEDAHAEGNTQGAPRLPLSIKDFDLLGVLGDGSLSTVFHACRKETGEEVALKVIDKAYIHRHRMVDAVVRERRIMDSLRSPWFVRLLFTFQDREKLYMAMELARNGDLFEQLRLRKPLPLEDVRIYAAEMVLILEALRAAGVMFRDFKPENLLLDDRGHLKLTDFGCAKDWVAGPPRASCGGTAAAGGGGRGGRGAFDRSASKRAVTFVGTADYVSPEVLSNTGCTPATDLWGFACVLYQMLAGAPPFRAQSEYLTMQRVAERDLRFPASGSQGLDALPAPAPPAGDPAAAATGAAAAAAPAPATDGGSGLHEGGGPRFSRDARDLVDALLAREPGERLGARDVAEVKAHPYFAGIPWDTLRSGPSPPFVVPERRRDHEAELWEMEALQASLEAASPGQASA